jgi:hypothetical protein
MTSISNYFTIRVMQTFKNFNVLSSDYKFQNQGQKVVDSEKREKQKQKPSRNLMCDYYLYFHSRFGEHFEYSFVYAECLNCLF